MCPALRALPPSLGHLVTPAHGLQSPPEWQDAILFFSCLEVGRVTVPEMKCELDCYEYVLVQTNLKYVLFTQSTVMYLVRTIWLFSLSTYLVHTHLES